MAKIVTGSYFDVTIICTVCPVFGASGRFSRVSGLGVEFEYEYYNEGGNNFHRAFFKEVKRQTLVMEQGTVTDGDSISACVNMINLGVDLPFTIIVCLKTNTGETVREWTIAGARLTKYEGPMLDSNQSEIAVSRIEFVYSGAF